MICYVVPSAFVVAEGTAAYGGRAILLSLWPFGKQNNQGVRAKNEKKEKTRAATHLVAALVYRTGRDSNPRYAFDVHTISNRALSTTQTPAHA